MKPQLNLTPEVQRLLGANDALEEMAQSVDNLNWRYLLRVRDMHAYHPVVFVDMARARLAWLKSGNAKNLDTRKRLLAMQWASSIKLPMNMPFAAALDHSVLYLNEGNHTFDMISNVGQIGAGIDMVVQPEFLDNVRAEFGLTRPSASPLSEQHAQQYKPELLLGLGLLQDGTVVDGWRKQSIATLQENGQSYWANCDDPTRIITTEALIAEADAIAIYQGAKSFPRLALNNAKFNVKRYIDSPSVTQSRYLGDLFSFRI